MSIDRLGSIDPVSPIKKANKEVNSNLPVSKDSISVSEEAKLKVSMLKSAEEVHSAPDIRENLIQEVKQKLQNPSYINDKLLSDVANNILNSFGL